jgi:calmodulin
MKVYAPWCRACKGLAPKYQQIANDDEYANVPMAFTSMSIQDNKDYVKSIGVLALPTVQLYKNGKLVDNFPCGPSKVPILKQKLHDLVARSYDPETGLIKSKGKPKGDDLVAEKPAGTPPVAGAAGSADVPEHEYLTTEQIEYMRNKIPFFQPIPDEDFDVALRSAKILSFDRNSVIMREGNPGETFYVILEGEVEICQRTAFEDPLITPPDYIGTVINRLKAGDWFGERALITGEPRAASIRVTQNLRCVAFTQREIPASCILSGMPSRVAVSEEAQEMEEKINEKYGLSMRDLDDLETSQQIRESYLINQKRGSTNNPQVIPGVDTDEDFEIDSVDEEEEALTVLGAKTASIIPVLEKFKLIRLISRCFDYIVASGAEWGNPAVRKRRSLLVSRLPRSQREEFVEAFNLVDTNGDGGISMRELQAVMETIGEEKSEDEVNEIIPHGYTEGANGEDVMSLQDFIGIMAEVEFYYLFRDVFASLDKRNAGFVKAADLDRVLCGVRDLISDDRHSIIDVEDKEMSIDYEQFTRMLLGLTL